MWSLLTPSDPFTASMCNLAMKNQEFTDQIQNTISRLQLLINARLIKLITLTSRFWFWWRFRSWDQNKTKNSSENKASRAAAPWHFQSFSTAGWPFRSHYGAVQRGLTASNQNQVHKVSKVGHIVLSHPIIIKLTFICGKPKKSKLPQGTTRGTRWGKNK